MFCGGLFIGLWSRSVSKATAHVFLVPGNGRFLELLLMFLISGDGRSLKLVRSTAELASGATGRIIWSTRADAV